MPNKYFIILLTFILGCTSNEDRAFYRLQEAWARPVMRAENFILTQETSLDEIMTFYKNRYNEIQNISEEGISDGEMIAFKKVKKDIETNYNFFYKNKNWEWDPNVYIPNLKLLAALADSTLQKEEIAILQPYLAAMPEQLQLARKTLHLPSRFQTEQTVKNAPEIINILNNPSWETADSLTKAEIKLCRVAYLDYIAWNNSRLLNLTDEIIFKEDNEPNQKEK